MYKKTVIRKIVSGDYDTHPNNFIRAYDTIFKWMITRVRSVTLNVNIYSFDFMLIYDVSVETLNPYFDNNMFIIHINNIVLPRYGLVIMNWIRVLHGYSNELSKYVVGDITEIIMDYII
jgi:hypothetical protein